jgi:hypothetical protein
MKQMEGASTFTTCLYSKEANLKVKIAKHVPKALQGELGTMQATLHEVELAHNVLHEQLCTLQRRIEVLECETIKKQTTLMEVETRAVKVKRLEIIYYVTIQFAITCAYL